MTNIRRYWQPGQICFLTHVTYLRMPLLVLHASLLKVAIERQRNQCNFELIAWAILPDHVHLLIDPCGNDVSNLMRRIKLSFSSSLRLRMSQSHGRIWQNRYWDRIMRDQEEINRHIDYINFNPAKHGYVKDPFTWEHSSIHKFLAAGVYERNWRFEENGKLAGEVGLGE